MNSVYPKLTDQEYAALRDIAISLSVNIDWLYKLIDFESRWDPLARNPVSSARGLIQFTDTTTRRLFDLPDADDLVLMYPDRISQLKGPVYRYLKPYSPFLTEQALAMSVFYPAYRNVSPDTLFPDTVIANNPGIKTPSDYINKVFGFNPILTLAIIGGVAMIGYFIYSLSQKG